MSPNRTGQGSALPSDASVVHGAVHNADGSSSDGLVIAGGSAAASAAGLAGFVVWRRRRALA